MNINKNINNIKIRSWIPILALVLFLITGIELKEINSIIADIYIFWGLGSILIDKHDMSRKQLFWVMFPIIIWAYVCIGIVLTIDHPKTWMKRLMIIYRNLNNE